MSSNILGTTLLVTKCQQLAARSERADLRLLGTAAPPADVLAQAIAQALDAVVIVDAAGEVRYWNKGAERIFGSQAHEMLGSTLDPIIPERLRQRHTEGSRSVIARYSQPLAAAG